MCLLDRKMKIQHKTDRENTKQKCKAQNGHLINNESVGLRGK